MSISINILHPFIRTALALALIHAVWASEPAITMQTALIDWPDTATVVGSVASAQHSRISPRVNGVILELPVRLGDTVTAGTVLVRMEAEELRARLAEAQAQVALANADLARVEQLIASGTASAANADSVRAAAAQAQAALHAAETMVGYLTIRAPYDGVITARHAETGDMAQPGRALLEMADPQHLRFEARIPEHLAHTLNMSDVVNVHIGSAAFAAPVVEIAAAADPQSRSVMVKADLDNEEDMAGLRIGQFGRMHLTIGSRQVVAIPASALIQRGQLEQVAVIVDQTVHLRLVRTGRRWHQAATPPAPNVPAGEAWIEIVAGLTADETIIRQQPQRWRDGQSWTGEQP